MATATKKFWISWQQFIEKFFTVQAKNLHFSYYCTVHAAIEQELKENRPALWLPFDLANTVPEVLSDSEKG